MEYRNPTPTTDVIVHRLNKQGHTEVLLIKRINPPHGWALPGGFVDEGEMVERAAIREVLEETGLKIELEQLLYVYSNPKRDSRQHNLSIVYTAQTSWEDSLLAQGGDDAAEAQFFSLAELPTLVFDHAEIITDFVKFLANGTRPTPQMKLHDEIS